MHDAHMDDAARADEGALSESLKSLAMVASN